MKRDFLILLSVAVANSPTGAVPDANDAALSSSGETIFTLTRQLESLSNASVSGELRANMDNRYPGYTGDVNTTGSVIGTFPAEGFVTKFSYDLQGLEPECTNCGIHIHTGKTCDIAGEILGHYYGDLADPWTLEGGAVYNSDKQGTASGSFELRTGYDTLNDNVGHAVVIHGQDGTRLSCGILGIGASDTLMSDVEATSSSDNDSSGVNGHYIWQMMICATVSFVVTMMLA